MQHYISEFQNNENYIIKLKTDATCQILSKNDLIKKRIAPTYSDHNAYVQSVSNKRRTDFLPHTSNSL